MHHSFGRRGTFQAPLQGKMKFFLKKIGKTLASSKIMRTFATEIEKQPDSVAQLVEQMTLNHWVESSSLSGVTSMKKPELQQQFRLFSDTSPADSCLVTGTAAEILQETG